MKASERALTVDELNVLPTGTVVRDLDDDELGEIKDCVFGGKHMKKIVWDNGCVSVNLTSGTGLRVAVNRREVKGQ